MAKINQGIFGAVQGKIGNLVGSSYKGIPVLKSKAASVANPQTADQTEQRDRMTAAVAFAKIILAAWIKPLWDRFAVKMSGYNLWIQKNVAAFATGTLVTPSDLIMSVGNMSATEFTLASATPGQKNYVINWIPDTAGFHLASDIAFFLAWNSVTNEFVFVSNVLRSVGTATATFSDNLSENDVIYSWLCFRRANGLYISLASELETTVL